MHIRKQSNILLVILSLILVASLIFSIGCQSTSKTKFSVTLIYNDEVTDNKVIEVVSGERIAVSSPTRDNYTFDGWFENGVQFFIETTPITKDTTLVAKWSKVIPANLTVTLVYNDGITADKEIKVINGEKLNIKNPKRDSYKFIGWQKDGVDFDIANTPITEDVTLSAVWELNLVECTIDFIDNENVFVTFEGEKPSILMTNSVLKFSARKSIYAVGELEVYANDELVTGVNGEYSITVKEDLEITFDGIEDDTTKMAGNGTENSPYIISTPTNFKEMANNVNGQIGNYASAHYLLNNDIDFMNEEFEIIGNGDIYQNSYIVRFAGHFDGNGKTIKNAKITKNGDMQMVGIFGYVVVSGKDLSSGLIENVNVTGLTIKSNFTIDKNGNGRASFVGGLVGYMAGGNVIGCNVESNIDVNNATGYASFIGGIIGYQSASYLGTNRTNYYSYVSYSKAKADIKGNGIIFAIGGVTGYLSSPQETTSAFITNCITEGKYSGALKAGGIVGEMGQYTAVSNCYSSSNVNANSDFDENIVSELAYSFAGGIVGVADGDTFVGNSFFTGSVRANAYNTDNAYEGDIAALTYPKGQPKVTSNKSMVLYCNRYSEIPDKQTILDNQKWNENEWIFVNGELPGIEQSEVDFSFTLKINLNNKTIGGEDNLQYVLSDYYLPLSAWQEYGYVDDKFISDDKFTGYSLFFDKECTQPVTVAYVITGNIELYVGWANYFDIEDTYYVNVDGDEVRFIVYNNGYFGIVQGAISDTCYYYFDGENIYVKDSAINMVEPSKNETFVRDDYVGKFTDGKLLLWNNSKYTEENPLVAYRKNKLQGQWFNSSNERYEFYVDGTGKSIEGVFSYTLSNDNITITFKNHTITATYNKIDNTIEISGDEFFKKDAFAGNWESNIDLGFKITFDGIDNYTIVDNKGVLTQGTYSISQDNVLTAGSYQFEIKDNNFMYMLFGGNEIRLSKEGGFIGYWKDDFIDYNIYLQGIDVNGIGYAIDSNGYSLTYQYVGIDKNETDMLLEFYYYSMTYGFGSYHEEARMLFLAMMYQTTIVDDFNLALVDQFEGTWFTDDDLFSGKISFNGYGNYDINNELNSGEHWIVEGHITIDDNDIRYYIINNQVNFTYNNIEYIATVTLDDKLVISKKNSTETFEFVTTDGFEFYKWDTKIGDISFDGLGLKRNGGKVKINNIEYKYLINGDYAEVFDIDNALIYKIKVVDYKLQIKDKNDVVVDNAGIKNIFTGKWAVSGMFYEFEIKELDNNYSGTVIFNGKEAKIGYENGSSLSFRINGSTYYVVALVGGNLALSMSSDLTGTYFIVGRTDEVFGIYHNDDYTLSIDGLGGSGVQFDSNKMKGTLLLEDENEIKVYYYLLENDKYIVYSYSENNDYVECGEIVKTSDKLTLKIDNNTYTFNFA